MYASRGPYWQKARPYGNMHSEWAKADPRHDNIFLRALTTSPCLIKDSNEMKKVCLDNTKLLVTIHEHFKPKKVE
jgi:hypothetical protein